MTAATPLTLARLREIAASHRRQGDALAVDHPVDLQERCDHRAISELLAEVTRLQGARTYSPFSAAPCPLCEYADGRLVVVCTMHAEIADLQATITRLRSELDHATTHDGDHLSKASRRMVDTVMGDRDALRAKVRERDARIAALESELLESSEQHGVYRDRAQLIADRVLADELRITALEAGLRDVLDRFPHEPRWPSEDDIERNHRLRALVDNTTKETP